MNPDIKETDDKKYPASYLKEKEESAISLEPWENCTPSVVKGKTRKEREEQGTKRSPDETGQFEKGGKRTRKSTRRR